MIDVNKWKIGTLEHKSWEGVKLFLITRSLSILMLCCLTILKYLKSDKIRLKWNSIIQEMLSISIHLKYNSDWIWNVKRLPNWSRFLVLSNLSHLLLFLLQIKLKGKTIWTSKYWNNSRENLSCYSTSFMMTEKLSILSETAIRPMRDNVMAH